MICSLKPWLILFKSSINTSTAFSMKWPKGRSRRSNEFDYSKNQQNYSEFDYSKGINKLILLTVYTFSYSFYKFLFLKEKEKYILLLSLKWWPKRRRKKKKKKLWTWLFETNQRQYTYFFKMIYITIWSGEDPIEALGDDRESNKTSCC